MATRPASAGSMHRRLMFKLLASAAIAALLPACTPSFLKGRAKAPSLNLTKAPKPAQTTTNPLYQATAYWARQHKKRPNDPQAALNYARNLKAVGSKPTALAVLKDAYAKHPGQKDIASEYGRLVLEDGNARLALRILKQAELPQDKTDWRVMSAEGTAYAKLGDHAKAQRYLTAALKKKPDSASLRNNLALSYAMSGSAGRAETLLRQTIKGGYDTPRVRQNLALVLGLQGKFKESEQLASIDLPENEAEANTSYLRSMINNKAAARAELTTQADVASATPAGQRRSVIASASVPQRSAAARSEAQPRQLSSRTLPLPWTTHTTHATGSIARVAQAKPAPLPTRKPAGPATRPGPAPKPARGQPASTTTAAAEPAPLPWQPGAALSKDRRVAAASWRTSVVAEVDTPKLPKSTFKPFSNND